jgi:hypothetical protein
MILPRKITFRWLRENVPAIESEEEFDELVALMRARRWRETRTPSNFIGRIEADLRPDVRRVVVRSRNERERARRAAGRAPGRRGA